ncbi:hypothetical protein GOP47_0005639 [Adiantum capillus-veneris]|uniref:Pentatricopeptide repeat-containing protein n=1 Tax=Adiantum capillus-veneris TaxID=13818 RepID=A0A9D4V5G0_ADICA|nr:hypothetical protein GOP47_0005639 [Adiantum capillus-veneris]
MPTSHPSIEDFLHSFKSTPCVHHLHALICQSGLEAYPSLGSELISSLTNAQSIGPAQQVFHKLVYQDAYCWNSLITGCVKCRDFKLARNAFDHMQGTDSLQPSVHAYAALLKACAMTQDIEWGCKLYTEMAQNGLLDTENFTGSALVNMFAKCGSLEKAQTVFDKLRRKDVVSWNALIAGYVDQGKGDNALECFGKMQQLGVSSSSTTLVCGLAACCSTSNVIKGQEMHAEALKKGFDVEVSVGNSLVDMYAKCGQLDTAQKVFNNLVVRDVVSWNVLITGHIESGQYEDAFCLFELMHVNAFSPDDVTFLCSIKACASVGIIGKGWTFHDKIIKFGLEKESLIANTLVDMYAKCGSLATAERLLCAPLTSDVVLWNAIVAAYADYGCADDALNCIKKMYEVGVSPNFVTFISLLKGCSSSVEATLKGCELHSAAVKYGFENELLLGSALVDMYCKCGLLVDAWNVFNNLQIRNAVSWNTIIAGYTKLGHSEEAFHCFVNMKSERVSPCATTFVPLLKACSNMGASGKHQELHAEIAKLGLDGELLISNVLVDLYMKYGLLADCQHIFYRISNQDVVSWSSVISGLTERGFYEEALDCSSDMQQQGISPNSAIYVCSVKACGNVGVTIKGQELHTAIVKQGFESESLVGNILVDMYANSGCLVEAQDVFDALFTREVIAWNALISGYAQLGESEKVVNVFDRMSEEGAKPDHITFLSILHACSHAGVVDRGLQCFEAIVYDYGLLPTLKQYTCVVDVLGRAGFLEKAVAVIERIPFQPDIAVWLIVLGACRKWADVGFGKRAFEHAVQLGEGDSTPYVCMSNIYRDAAMLEEAKIIEALRLDRRRALKNSRHDRSKYFSEFTEVLAQNEQL